MSKLNIPRPIESPTSDAARLMLNACPYCHTSDLLACSTRDDGWVGWSVSCACCGVVGPLAKNESTAAHSWNELAASRTRVQREAGVR